VVNLTEGFETPFGLELMATVHWVATKEHATTFTDLVAGIYTWDERKKRFSEEQIKIAWNVLRNKGWLTTQ
jgi:hypothetical protein